MEKAIGFMQSALYRPRRFKARCKTKISGVVLQNSGEGYVDTALKILISVVIGALLLAGLYALFGDTIMPTVTSRIKEMFNYKG